MGMSWIVTLGPAATMASFILGDLTLFVLLMKRVVGMQCEKVVNFWSY
jgi:hypothetical protein